jgi:endonuclease YncB( thermonuclease family)
MNKGQMRHAGASLLGLLAAVALALPDDAAARGRGGSSGSYRSYSGAKAIDGDTFRYRGERYRLRDYNAPERGQPGSSRATQNLQRRLDSGNYEYKPVGRDVYGRPIVKERRTGN